MENLCINTSKIIKLRIHQNSMHASKPDCPMKSENSGIVTTVAHFRCWCMTCCNLVNWKLCFVYCTFVSLFFHSPLPNLLRLSTAWRRDEGQEDRMKGISHPTIQTYKEYIRVHHQRQDFLCIHNCFNASSRGEI